jgi:hypothetical protein
MPQVAMIRTEELKMKTSCDAEEIRLTAKSVIDLNEGTLCHKTCTGEDVVGQSTPTFTKEKRWEWTIIDKLNKIGCCKCLGVQINCDGKGILLNPQIDCNQYCINLETEKGVRTKDCCECIYKISQECPFQIKKDTEAECKEFCIKTQGPLASPYYIKDTKCCSCMLMIVPKI